MLISTKHIKLQHNEFIDEMYDIYNTLRAYNAFVDNSNFETETFKVWKYKDNYYILDKRSGRLITWYKLLGWNLSSNDTMKLDDFKRFCQNLRNDFAENSIIVLGPGEMLDE